MKRRKREDFSKEAKEEDKREDFSEEAKEEDKRENFSEEAKKSIQGKRKIGEGENATVYDADDGEHVFKVILLGKTPWEDVVREHEIQFAIGQEFGSRKIVGGISQSILTTKVNREDVAIMKLEKLASIPDKPGEEFFRDVLQKSDDLVLAGFLHNDLHLGNIMMTQEGEGVVIDFGLTQRIAPLEGKIDDDIITCVQFAQAAAMVDMCNRNNMCPNDEIYKLLMRRYVRNGRSAIKRVAKKLLGEKSVQAVAEEAARKGATILETMGGWKKFDYLRGMEDEEHRRILKQQVWLAIFSLSAFDAPCSDKKTTTTHYQKHDVDVCENPIVDQIYAIRNGKYLKQKPSKRRRK